LMFILHNYRGDKEIQKIIWKDLILPNFHRRDFSSQILSRVQYHNLFSCGYEVLLDQWTNRTRMDTRSFFTAYDHPFTLNPDPFRSSPTGNSDLCWAVLRVMKYSLIWERDFYQEFARGQPNMRTLLQQLQGTTPHDDHPYSSAIQELAHELEHELDVAVHDELE